MTRDILIIVLTLLLQLGGVLYSQGQRADEVEQLKFRLDRIERVLDEVTARQLMPPPARQ